MFWFKNSLSIQKYIDGLHKSVKEDIEKQKNKACTEIEDVAYKSHELWFGRFRNISDESFIDDVIERIKKKQLK